MRVIVPATADGLHHATVDALLRSEYWDGWAVPPSIEIYAMTREDSYYQLVHALWAGRETFVIVEHDIVVTPDVLRGFAECPEPWCAHSYDVFAGDVATVYGGAFALGCTKFDARLLLAERDAVTVAGDMEIDGTGTWPKRSYGVMDATLTQTLRQRGYKPHQHQPNVTHLHVYNRDGISENAWPSKARTW